MRRHDLYYFLLIDSILYHNTITMINLMLNYLCCPAWIHLHTSLFLAWISWFYCILWQKPCLSFFLCSRDSNCSNIALIIRFLLICDRQEKPERNIHIPIRLISEWNICMPLCPCYLLLYDYQAMPVVMINRAYPDALCFNHLLLRHEKSTLVVF